MNYEIQVEARIILLWYINISHISLNSYFFSLDIVIIYLFIYLFVLVCVLIFIIVLGRQLSLMKLYSFFYFHPVARSHPTRLAMLFSGGACNSKILYISC